MSSEKIFYEPPSDEKIVQGSSYHATEKETYQNPYTSYKETLPSYPPTPVSPPQPTPWKERSDPIEPRPTEPRPVNKFPTLVVAILAVIILVLAKLFYFPASAHVAECISSSASFNPSGPIIAVMGATGTGKSSFIRDLQGRDSRGCLPKVGHGLQSCTKNVTWYSASLTGQAFTILDTPGFDDIALSDSSILQDLATELASIYQGRRHLAGLIYLHDISKVKMGRTSYKNLQLFQKLVGSQSLKNVMLITTHWSSAEYKDTPSREKELKSSFWQAMIKQGSQVSRHEGTVNSARKIAGKLVNKSSIVPKITDELVRQKLRFGQTEAGKMVSEDLKAFGADTKDEISSINIRLEEMAKQREEDALKAKKEKEQLQHELRTALQEATKKDEARREMEALNNRLEDEKRERAKAIQELKKEKE
ncbi:hypothetical protein K505DRAFT_242837, partial [Melanomma pulvis-pyrius CBS 109.77]